MLDVPKMRRHTTQLTWLGKNRKLALALQLWDFCRVNIVLCQRSFAKFSKLFSWLVRKQPRWHGWRSKRLFHLWVCTASTRFVRRSSDLPVVPGGRRERHRTGVELGQQRGLGCRRRGRSRGRRVHRHRVRHDHADQVGHYRPRDQPGSMKMILVIIETASKIN